MSNTKYRKKLIEVALPLEAINVASAREKSIRHSHPSTLHLWWARRPLAACRAVLFASLVNDPEDDPMYGISEDVAFAERAKLFDLIEELVLWENSNNPRVINAARLEIARSIAANKVADKEWNDNRMLVANAPVLPKEQSKNLPDLPPEYTPKDVRFKMPGLKPEQVNHFLAHYAPPVLDPFAGGGSIPLEAQRLGLRAYASDLNPVPVLINKALIEIPPKFAGQPPVNPNSQKGKLKSKQWQGSEGLAEDVRYYGNWMRAEAEKRIGHMYPNVRVTQEMVDDGRPDLNPYVGKELTVIAWVWARTVRSSNPIYAESFVPLASSFWLSKKKGKEVWVEPIINRSTKTLTFRVRLGEPNAHELRIVSEGTKLGRGCKFKCIFSETPIPEEHIKAEGMSDNLSDSLMAIVCEGNRERVYISPIIEHERAARVVSPSCDGIDVPIGNDKRAIWCLLYGLSHFNKLFTPRQLTTLTTFADLVIEARNKIVSDCQNTDDKDEYGNAVATYLGFIVSKFSSNSASVCSWGSHAKDQMVKQVFGRQAIPMIWDFAESNPFSTAGGTIESHAKFTANAIATASNSVAGIVRQSDAAQSNTYSGQLIATDPPYYDNIGYADLSDFFYVWLRRSLKEIYPDVLGTVLTPKSNELIASPYRHGGKEKAAFFFEAGLGQSIANWRAKCCSEFPTTIFYAFRQSETDSEGTASTGWESFLAGIIEHGFAITATWPVRTELTGNLKKLVSALASSIVLACVPRAADATIVTRRDFANAMRKELPDAIKHLQSGNVAPVDLAQASIGPGMAVFSRYSRVINADGSAMTVREALQLINQVLDESLVEQESDFDSETRFALKWFEQYGLGEGPFGDAENLSKAMAVSVKGIEDAGILRSKAGKVRLLKRDELDPDWDPASDSRLTMWEVAQHLIRTLESDGESGTADLLRRIGSEKGDIARELAYRLYQTCERKSLAKEAGAYNALVVSWPEITRLSRNTQPKTVASLLPGMEDDQ
jgi:putative DNA methylase